MIIMLFKQVNSSLSKNQVLISYTIYLLPLYIDNEATMKLCKQGEMHSNTNKLNFKFYTLVPY